ncbi:MAG: hypothetical protein D6732_25650 [Methanobacteriota archaeon]|nr:MAG: hypothetical protein D6732_25650 [Euryarchaeota archaeon]
MQVGKGRGVIHLAPEPADDAEVYRRGQGTRCGGGDFRLRTPGQEYRHGVAMQPRRPHKHPQADGDQ